MTDIKTLNDDELEAKYPYEFFYHYNKISDYKFRTHAMEQPCGGQLHFKNIWIFGPPFWQKKMGQQFSIVPSDIPQEHKQVVGRLLIKVITIFKIFYKNCYIKLCILFNCNAQINHFNDNLLRKLKDYINNLRKKLKR